jgi:hypothetical protein
MQFEDIIKQMPVLFDQLQKAPMVDRSNVQRQFPFQGGIYVLYENGRPLYVGRTKRHVAKRVLIHGRACSRHNAASFAFLLAKERAEREGLDLRGTRVDLENDKRFNTIFSKQKERISKMKVRVVHVSDPETQAIFEIYASKLLRTKYNDFDTH